MTMFKKLKEKTDSPLVGNFVKIYETYVKGHIYINKYEGKRDLTQDHITFSKIEHYLKSIWRNMGDSQRQMVFDILVSRGHIPESAVAAQNIFNATIKGVLE